MTDTFFFYGDLDTEIARRLGADDVPATEQARALLDELARRGMATADVDRLRQMCGALGRAGLDVVYAGYMGHLVRVAASLAREPEGLDVERIAAALVHNVREIAHPELDTIQHMYAGSPDSARALDLLRTDRRRERDGAYLVGYYDGIAGGPPYLLLLKALDKLDNLLSYVMDDLEAHHFEVVTDHLVPRLAPRHPRLADYLSRLVPYVRSTEARTRFRAGGLGRK